MVRPARMGRSRGCAPCRKKRIKCDLGTPICQRCIDSRIRCPGPISGAFIVTATPFLPKPGRRAQQQQQPFSHPDPLAHHKDRAEPIASLSLTLALDNTPSSAFLLDTFIRYFSHSARKSSWTFALPSLSKGAAPLAKPFKSALHAVALAHFANSTSDALFSQHAALEYSRSLSLQRASLARLTLTDDGYGITTDSTIIEAVRYALLASTVLSYYELIAAVTPTAWMTHTIACEQLLGLIGPDMVGQDRILRQIAVSVRCHAVTRVVMYGHRSMFVRAEWREAIRKWTSSQQQSVSRDAYDWVVEFLLRVCSFVHSSSHTISCPDSAPTTQQADAVAFRDEMHSNYTDWLTAMDPSLSLSPTSLPLVAPPCLPTAPLSAQLPEMPPQLQSPFPAMALAHFHAAALLLQYHFPGVFPDADATWNCRWLLSACRNLEQNSRTNATAVLRMGLPFAIAWKCCVDHAERQHMRATFEAWARREGMSGLNVVGFPE